jgi:16S rRNA (guanine527-N7)-methyltransferase
MSSAPRKSAARPSSSSSAVRKAPPLAWTTEQWQQAMQRPLAELGLALTPAQQALLARYMGVLSHWNATYNLTALRDAPDMLSHHLVDCLAVLAPLQKGLQLLPASGTEGAQLRLLDVGSGGGLPGVVIAIAMPNVQVTCVDTVGKKAAFVRQVAAELKLPNLRGEHARVEQLKGQFDLITSRAFASLSDFVSLTGSLLAPGAVWMAMKGKRPDDELEHLPAGVNVFHVEPLHVPALEAERCLVWMRPA